MFSLLLIIIPIVELNFIIKRIIPSTIIILFSFITFWGLDFQALIAKSCYLGALIAALFSGYKTSEQVINTYFMVSINDETITKMGQRLSQSVDLQFQLLKQQSDQLSSHKMFVDNLFAEYDELLLLKDNKGFTWFGLCFTIYCGIRVISAFLNLIFTTNNQQDLVTRIMDYIVFKKGYNINIHAWTTNLSFLIIGAMGISAIQSLLREFRKVSNNFIINSELTVLVITHCIGFYFLALLLMIVRSLPPKYHTGTVFLFGGVDLVQFSQWFDAWFLLAVACSGVLYYLYLKSHSNYF